jgi:hypothetical protein
VADLHGTAKFGNGAQQAYLVLLPAVVSDAAP